jgi:hypothetical protein
LGIAAQIAPDQFGGDYNTVITKMGEFLLTFAGFFTFHADFGYKSPE